MSAWAIGGGAVVCLTVSLVMNVKYGQKAPKSREIRAKISVRPRDYKDGNSEDGRRRITLNTAGYDTTHECSPRTLYKAVTSVVVDARRRCDETR